VRRKDIKVGALKEHPYCQEEKPVNEMSEECPESRRPTSVLLWQKKNYTSDLRIAVRMFRQMIN
jgi:hypothetical protein